MIFYYAKVTNLQKYLYNVHKYFYFKENTFNMLILILYQSMILSICLLHSFLSGLLSHLVKKLEQVKTLELGLFLKVRTPETDQSLIH